MHVVISSPNPRIAMQVAISCTMANLPSEVEPSIQEFGSKLFRDPDAIGVLWAPGPASAAEHCRRFRLGDIRNLVFALIEEDTNIGKQVNGRVLVLGAGADEVQPWPIESAELVARLFALQRRSRSPETPFLDFAGCRYNRLTGQISGPEGRAHLTSHEHVLFEALSSRPGVMVTKAVCMLALYNGIDEAQEKIIDVYVHKLRRKLAAVSPRLEFIETVWGQGYRFVPSGFKRLAVIEGGACA